MKKKGFVEKTLYGNDKEDFTLESLPINRVNAFIKIIKTNWINLFLLSMIVTLSFCPIYFMNMAKNAYIIDKTQLMDESLIMSFTLSTNLIFSLISIPLFILSFIILEGVIGIIKRMTFREGFLFFSDLKKEIKSGFKNTLITSIVFSVILSFCSFNFSFLNNSNVFIGIRVAILIVAILMLIFNIIVALFNLNLNSIYNLTIKNMYKNSLLLLFSKPLKNILFAFIFCLPILLTIFAPSLLISAIFLVMLFLFLSSLIILIFFLYSTYIFDIYINEKHCPSIYRKGLRK